MKRQIKIILSIISIFLLTSVIVSSENKISKTIKITNPESHLIKDVPYVGQYDNCHCSFATKTMMIKNFEKNTTLEEIIFLYGTAFSLYLPKDNPKVRHPSVGIGLSQTPEDSKYVGGLFDLSFDNSYKGDGLTVKEEYWNSYWKEIKENVSQNIPVEVCVSPYQLPSIQKIFNLKEFFWKNNKGGHAIIIIGYNERNQSVCYNDPLTLFYGNASYGIYDWMSIKTFKHAVETAGGMKYEILRFYKNNCQNNKEDILFNAYQRNIEKLKGTKSVYGVYFSNYSKNSYLGINASIKLDEYFNKGLNNRFRTNIIYKLSEKLAVKHNIILFLQKYFPSLPNKIPFNYNDRLENVFDILSYERSLTADFLLSKKNISYVYEYTSEKLYQEAENWSKIANLYRNFQEKGVFLSTKKAISTISNMQKIMEDIIKIEEEIIIGPIY